MGKTIILKEGSWLERATLLFGFDKYDFYIAAAQGESIKGKTLAAIPATDYKSRLANEDIFIILRDSKQSDINKSAIATVETVVVVGMDQWVVTDTAKKAAVCTSGIIGCIGLALFGGSQVAVTHLLDGFEAKDKWPDYQKTLLEMIGAMARVDRAVLVRSSSIYVDKCELVAAFLDEKGIDRGRQTQEVAGGFAVRGTAMNSWTFTQDDKPLTLFKEPKALPMSRAELHIIKSGKLSAMAADSGG